MRSDLIQALEQRLLLAAAPALSIGDISVVEGNGGAWVTDANFTITLSEPSDQAVSVRYATSSGTAAAGTDFEATSLTATFAAGETSKTVRIRVNGDTSIEGNETFTVSLSNPVNATIARGVGSCVIANDDQPSVSVGDIAVSEGASGTTQAVFTVTLSAPHTETVSVQYITADVTARAGSDYAAAAGVVAFEPGMTSRTVTVLVQGDVLEEPEETFLLNLTGATGATVARGSAVATVRNYQQPGVSINDLTVSEGYGGVTEASFTVSLSAPSQETVSVYYATADGTATAGGDYVASSGTLVFSPGQTSQTLTVLIQGDTLLENDESFSVQLSGAVFATLSDASGTVSIRDDEPRVTVSDAAAPEGSGPGNDLVFTVSLTTASDGPVTVDYWTADGTATAGADYAAASGTLVFAPGQTTQTVRVATLDDDAIEPAETMDLVLGNAVGAILARECGVGTIQNGDYPTVWLSDAAMVEGDSQTTHLAFAVTLSAASGSPLTLAYSTVDVTAAAGSDYQASSGSITFAAGQTQQTILVPILGDTAPELDETFALSVHLPAMVAINDVSVVEGHAGAWNGLAVFTVSLSSACSQVVSVKYGTNGQSATGGSDYQVASGTLVFAPGETTKTVAVKLNGDTLAETAETFTVNLHTPSGVVIADGSGQATILDDDDPNSPPGTASAGAVVFPAGEVAIARGQAVGTIGNDDAVTAGVDDVQIVEGSAGVSQAVFTVRLSGSPDEAVAVRYATADGLARAGEDYTATAGWLTFQAGQSELTVSVPILGDTLVESDETFILTLSEPVGVELSRGQATATIQNDDLPTLTIADVWVSEPLSGQAQAVFTLTLSVAAPWPVSVQYATADGSAQAGGDYVAAWGGVTIPAGQTAASVVVMVNADALAEGPETFLLNLSGVSGATLARAAGLATLVQNRPPTLNAGGSLGGAVEDIPLEITFEQLVSAVGAGDADGDALTLRIEQVLCGTLTHGGQPVTPGVTILSAGQSLQWLAPADAHGAWEAFAVRACDPTGVSANAAVVTVGVQAANDAPVAQPGDAAGLEDAPLTGQLIATDVDADPLTYSLAQGPAHGEVSVGASGQFVYTPMADWSGQDTFTFSVTDPAGATSIAAVVVSMAPLADAPHCGEDAMGTAEDTPVEVDVLANDSDADGDALEIVGIAPPQHGQVTWVGAGVLRYVPAAGFHGSDTFAYTVSDGQGHQVRSQVLVTVDEVNDAPTVGGEFYTLDQDTSLRIDVADLLGNDSDADNDGLAIVSVWGAEHGTVSLAEGVVTFTPHRGYVGPARFEYTVSDGRGGQMAATVSVEVRETLQAMALDAKTRVQFFDSTNDRVTIRLAGPGSGLVYRPTNGGDAVRIVLLGTTPKSSLTISTASRATTVVGEIVVEGSLKKIDARTADLAGDVTVAGSLGRLTVGNVVGGDSAVVIGGGGATGAWTAVFKSVSELSIRSGQPIASLTAAQWRDQDGQADVIAAPWLGRLSIRGDRRAGLAGDFQADVLLNNPAMGKAALGSAMIAGDFSQARWLVSGLMGRLKVGGTAEDVDVRSSGTMAGLTLGAALNADFLAGCAADVARYAQDRSDILDPMVMIKSITVVGLKTPADARARFVTDSHFSAGRIGAVKLANVAGQWEGAEASGLYVSALAKGPQVAGVTYRDTVTGESWRWSPKSTVVLAPVNPVIRIL